MKILFVLFPFFLFFLSCTDLFNSNKKIITEQDKALYAMGFNVAQKLKGFQLTKNELSLFLYGLEDSLKEKPLEQGQIFQPFVSNFARIRNSSTSEKYKKEGQLYVEKMLKEGFTKENTGLLYKINREGNENRATIADSVMIDFEGFLPNGELIDSSKGEKMTIPMTSLIKGWREALTKIGERGEIEIITPPELAYGDSGSSKIPGGSTLYFKIQLYKIEKF